MEQPRQTERTMHIGLVLLLDGGQVFYPVDLLYQLCPSAPSIGEEELLDLIPLHPVRMG
jgi:hypothetical protein